MYSEGFKDNSTFIKAFSALINFLSACEAKSSDYNQENSNLENNRRVKLDTERDNKDHQDLQESDAVMIFKTIYCLGFM